MPQVFNNLCALLLLEMSTESSQDVAIYWESIRTDIADTFTEIAN